MMVEEQKQPYPSRTPEAFRQQKRKQREREAELLRHVNERLAALNIDWKQLMRMIADGEVEIVVKEKAE
jgi:regulator of protease activity HflC (stomatin/prohibitin superfamily)